MEYTLPVIRMLSLAGTWCDITRKQGWMQRKTQMCGTPGLTARTLAVLCFAAVALGQAGVMVFVLSLGLDLLPAREPLPDSWPWAVNLAWLLAFAVQHTGMARTGFKRAWARVVP